MDSELLSVFHDDQYESSLNRYEENFWSVGNCDTFAPHLSENLNGILPISPIEEKLTYFDNELQIDHYSNNDLCKTEHSNISDQSQAFMLDSFIESGPTIEIISVDPNAEFEDDGEFDSSESFKSEYKHNYCQSLSDDDNQSHATFRSRTDSSSIGDYESHSSDESDFEDSSEYNICNQPISCGNISPTPNKITVETKLDSKNNVFSNNTVINHIDFVGSSVMVATNNSTESIEIDTENFDLATFITEDDFIPEKLIEYSSNDKNQNKKKNNGYESEEIVDIETVDDNNLKKYSQIKSEQIKVTKSNEDNMSNLRTNNLFEDDDVKKDPSWDPICKKKVKCVDKIIEKPTIKVTKNQPTKKLKTHNNISIRKKLQKTMQISDKNISFFNQLSARFNENKTNIKKEEKVNPKNELEKNIVMFNNKDSTVIEKLNLSQEHIFQMDEMEKEKTNICINKLSGKEVPVVPIKKKLNLEEYYKKRKGDLVVNSPAKDSKIILENKVSPIKQNIESNDQNPKISKITSQSLLIAKDLSMENVCRSQLDPIIEVKNKILRMQEMRKKAAQKRLIDIAVSSKVGPITKILPLEEIIKSNSNYLTQPQKYIKNSTNTEYEEIIIVSVSCNTDIKIPPKFDKSVAKNKSTSLLYNISNTIEKVKSNENLKISNNSLITSIKSVVLQKTIKDVQPIINKNGLNKQNSIHKVEHNVKNNVSNENMIDEHGEDKIIMHLPKNRVKQKTCSISTQTEMLPEFPLLELVMPIKLIKNTIKNRKYRHKNGEFTSMSSDSEKDSDDEYNKMRSNRYRSNSRSTCGSRHISPSENYNYNSSELKLKDVSCTINKERNRSRRKLRQNRNRHYSGSGHSTSSNYRSRSSSSFSTVSRSRSRSRSSERKYQKTTSNYYKKSRSKTTNRENSPAVEERRIVYVGRIEAETTKEDLKRKFIGYGPVKQITLHYKDTGMKYGFVTFERAEDAFKAIDNGNTDLKINMYDISFGGRRAFCRQSYADLDGAATNTFQHYAYNSVSSSRNSVLLSNNEKDDSFESLLKKVKEKLCASKSSTQKT